jgi:hypothetical protein
MRRGGQPAGEIAHLRLLGEIGPLEDQVRARYPGGDPAAGGCQPLIAAPDQDDRQALPRQAAGDSLADPAGRAGDDCSQRSLPSSVDVVNLMRSG